MDGRVRKVAIHRRGGAFAVDVDGHTWQVDVARIDGQTLSLIVTGVWPKKDSEADEGARRPGLIRPGSIFDVTISPAAATGQLTVRVGAIPVAVSLNGRRRRKEDSAHAGDEPERITAPMPGKMVRILVNAGDAVQRRQPVAVIEAMKMENELKAGRDGTVSDIRVKEGASVDAGALLMVIG